MAECSYELRDAGKPYPRTCALCGLGKCQKGLTIGVKQAEGAVPPAAGQEGVRSPMGWFYRVDVMRSDGNPSVYRCTLGSAWERMEIYDIGELSPAELRFIADVIDASKSKSVAA
jgi:hypothetical protein